MYFKKKITKNDFYKLRIFTYKCLIFFSILTLTFYMIGLNKIIKLTNNLDKFSNSINEILKVTNNINEFDQNILKYTKNYLTTRIDREKFIDPEMSELIKKSYIKIKKELEIKD